MHLPDSAVRRCNYSMVAAGKKGELMLIRANGTQSAKIVLVIETKAQRGLGTEKDPVREITQYWDLLGNFLAETDTAHCMPIIEHDAKVVNESI